MKLLIELKIDNLYKAKDFTDKKSGEVTPGKWKIQTFDKIKTEHGEQMKLIDISITDEYAKTVKQGETVIMPIGTFINNGRIGYYGI